MIEVLRLYKDIADAEETFFEFCVMYPAGEVLKFDGEVRILHLSRQRIFQASLKRARTINIEFAAGKKGRSEKWEALDVIPVRVANQEMNAMGSGPAKHVQSKHTNTRPTIEHERRAVLGTHFNTRRIAAIN